MTCLHSSLPIHPAASLPSNLPRLGPVPSNIPRLGALTLMVMMTPSLTSMGTLGHAMGGRSLAMGGRIFSPLLAPAITAVAVPSTRGCTGEFSKKKKFKRIFFSLQSWRYGLSYEYSSREILKKNILSCPKLVFSCFFLVLLANMQFWRVFYLFCLLVGPPNPCRLHPTSISYIYKVF